MLMSAIIGFASCDGLMGPEDETPKEMVLDSTEFSLPADGGEFQLIFVPNSAWTASCEDSFVSYDPKSGEAVADTVVMTVKVAKNKAQEARTSTLVLSFETNDVKVTIKQAGLTITAGIEQTEFQVSAYGEDIDIKFLPVADWEASCSRKDKEWISFDPESGTASSRKKTFTISVEENTDEEPREGIVYLAFANGEEYEFKITQDGMPKIEVTLKQKEYSVPAEGGVVEIKFVPLTKWEASANVDFLTFSPEKGEVSKEEVTLTVTVPETDLYEERVGELTLKFENNTEVVKITQKAKGEKVQIENTKYEVGWRGGTSEQFKIVFITPTKTDWTAESDKAFVKCTPAKGSSAEGQENVVTVTLDRNTQKVSRTATLTLSFATNDVEITIVQEACPPDTEFSKTSYEVPAEGGKVEIRFIPTMHWDSSWNGDFFTYEPKKGSEGEEVIMAVNFEPNPTESERTGWIEINLEVNPVKIYFVQAGQEPEPEVPVGKIDVTEYSVPAEGGTYTVAFDAVTDWEAHWKESFYGISLSPEWGAKSDAQAEITVVVDPNETNKGRRAVLSVSFEANTVYITFAQDPKKEDPGQDPEGTTGSTEDVNKGDNVGIK